LNRSNNKLAIGTAQFGMPYGIANKKGQVSVDEGRKILAFAKENGIHALDTAIGYGDSEKQLGEIGIAGWHVVTKLLSVPEDCIDIDDWVEKNIYASLERLKISTLYGVLLHKPGQLREGKGPSIYYALQKAKKQGLINKIGISVYSPDELSELIPEFDFDIVQAPFNVFDRRFVESGWLSKLAKANIEVHARSVFLQGLLLMPIADRPAAFNPWNILWEKYDNWLSENKLSPLEACLNHVLNYPMIDKVIVGVDSLQNIKEITGAISTKIPAVPEYLSCNELALINPYLW